MTLSFILLWLLTAPADVGADRVRQLSCDAAVYRQFDFWIGEWDVHTERTRETGKPAHNRVTSVSSGCALLEEYWNAFGHAGTSLSYFDDAARQWRQVLVDRFGRTTVLAGYFENGGMVLYDQASNGMRRVTWTPLPDGNVRQHGETSSNGMNWRTSFDALYAPR